MKHLFIRLYALVVVSFISIIIGIFIFNIIGDMSKEVENAQIAFESLEKAILNEVKASRLEDVTARQKLRRIADRLSKKGFVVQLAPSKGAVFSYPPDSSLFAIVNGNVFVKEESKFLKVFRTENYVNTGEENTIIHMTMIRSILPIQMIFLRSRTVFFLMIFIVLSTIGVFIYLKLNEREKVERVYTDFVEPQEIKRNNSSLRRNYQHYSFDSDSEEELRDKANSKKNNQIDSKSCEFRSYTPDLSSSPTNDAIYNRLENNDTPYNTADASYTNTPSSLNFNSSSNIPPLDEYTVSKDSFCTSNMSYTSDKGVVEQDRIGNSEYKMKNEHVEDHLPPMGLYSPKTGLVWRDYLPDILSTEIGKASSIDQDMSFILIKILDVDYSSLDLKRLADILVEVFRFRDMVFEYSDEETLGFAAILQDAYLDEAIRVCNGLFSKLQHEIFLTGQEPTIKMGVTTRACRLVSASTIMYEAERSLDNAMKNETEAIIGYRPSAEQYRQHSIENDR